MRERLRRIDLRGPIGVLSVACVLGSLWMSRGETSGLAGDVVLQMVLFLVAIALGETARLTILTDRETAPMSTAAALGLSFTGLTSPGDHQITASVVVATISLGMACGLLILRLATGSAHWGGTAARLLAAATAAVVYRSVDFGGHTLIEWQDRWPRDRWLVAVLMLTVGTLAMLVDLTLEAAVRAGRDHAPLLRSIIDEVRSTGGLATALVTSGALIALADFAVGVAALPLFLFPLVLTYFAVQRYATIRTTYRQTIGALSSLTDRAGYTRTSHAQRVADIAVAVGRDMGMGQRELTDLEYAALLHDLGQVALRAPIPQGATVMAAPADQQRIAHDGAEIVRTTGVLDNVAAILEAQTTPYRQVREFGQNLPMSSRIIKVANAYDDLCEPGGGDHRAMERIHLGLGYEYDPRVVDSLTRILERRQRSAASGS
ncbi:MAG: HD domain-containing phosphohydrolase [Terracoccus sp.]